MDVDLFIGALLRCRVMSKLCHLPSRADAHNPCLPAWRVGEIALLVALSSDELRSIVLTSHYAGWIYTNRDELEHNSLIA